MRIAAALLILGSASLRAAAAAHATSAAEQKGLICRIVDDAAAANHLPAAFLTRILWQESRFQADVTSPAGAQGIAQFMPKVAAEHGLAQPRFVGPAIAAAARFLAELATRFGNLGLAAAAYNAGAGRVVSWLRSGVDLPAETRRYVLAVTGRSAEDWAVNAASAAGSAAADRRPCLAVSADFGPSAPTWRAGSPAELQLYRALARAGRLLAAFSRGRSADNVQSSHGAERLCETLRSLGAHCEVY